MTRTVVGHLRIITENFDDISTYFGMIKCTVLPPRALLHPVLPYRTQGKLMFPLCKTCADTCQQTPCTHSDNERAIEGTWCSVELEKALEQGYRLLKIHEVWHFPATSDELFKEYINTFFKESLSTTMHCALVFVFQPKLFMIIIPLHATSTIMSDSEEDSDLNISRYDPEDDPNVYGSPICCEQQDAEDREGEQEHSDISIGPSPTRVSDQRSQVRILYLF